MPLVGFSCKCGDLPFNETIACAKSGRSKEFGCEQSFIALESMHEEFGKDKRPGGLSVTEIMQGDWGCHRSVWLQKKFPYYTDPTDLYRAWYGVTFHKLLNAPQHNSIREFRISKVIPTAMKDYFVSGQFDYMETERKILADVKNTKSIVEKWLPYDHHIIQVNLYASLARSIGLHVDRLEIHYFDQEGSFVSPVDVWKEEDCLDYFYKNLIPLADAIDNKEIPSYKKIKKCNYCPVLKKCHEFLDGGI